METQRKPGESNDLRKQLSSIRRDSRVRFDEAQVNWIRESYLIDGKTLRWMCSQLWPKATEVALWRIAVGKSYQKVPLSERLKAAHREAQELRKLPDPAVAPEEADSGG